MVKNTLLWLVVIGVLVLVFSGFDQSSEPDNLNYSEFVTAVSENQVASVEIDGEQITGEKKNGSSFETIRPAVSDDQLMPMLRENQVEVQGTAPKRQSVLMQLLIASFPILLIIGLFLFFMRNMQGGAGGKGGGPMSFGKSKAKMLTEDQIKVNFEDVAGCEEAKTELQEIVEFLKNSKKYRKIGAKIPKGALLLGPPGTGKTLLAKAAATSSDANFISVKGPEIVSKWVGESERGIREIFRRARQASPCIIFLDEMDSIAGSRQLETTGNHDQKLVSQLLTELDGIQELEDVIVIGATNRIDMIDPAIMRGGRFDKIINVGIPDKDAIKEIIKIHTDVLPKQTRKLINKKENMARIIQLTDGFTGADIASVTSKLVTMILEKHQKEMKDIETWKKKENKLLKKFKNEKRKWTSEKYPELNYNFDLYPEPLRSKRLNKISKKAEQDDTGTEWNNKEEEVRQAIRKMLEKNTDTNWLSNKYDDRKQFNKLKFDKDGKVIITLDTINVNELTVKENMEKETDTEHVRNEEIQLTKLKDDLQKEVNEKIEKIYNDFGQELFDQLNDLVEEKMLRYRLKIEEIETAIVGIREIKEGKPRELSMPRQVVKKTGFYG